MTRTVCVVAFCAVSLAGIAPATRSRAATQDGAWWTVAVASNSLAAVLGAEADAAWAASGGPFLIEEDPLLRRSVLVSDARSLTLDGRTAYGEVDISCRVRLAMSADRPSASFALSAIRPSADPKPRSLDIRLSGSYDGTITVSALDARAVYTPVAYPQIPPVWEDAVRIPAERDMAALPRAQQMWIRLRCEFRAGHVRVWVDDRLLLDRRDPELTGAGTLRLVLSPCARLADWSVRPGEPRSAAFEPIALDAWARDAALIGGQGLAADALPYGRTAAVAGIPFRFAERLSPSAPDHMDVGRSLYRQGNMEGYLPSTGPRWAGSFLVDPARLQLRIPNGRYEALHVIAAFDGEPDNVPTLSASFYRPSAGFAQVFEGEVPAARATAGEAVSGAQPLAVRLANGRRANLWLVTLPLDPGRLSSFADMETVELELSKEMRQFRSYPDPFLYGWHPAGLPSGVHVYALTLERPALEFAVEPTAFGHVWTAPAVPGYRLSLHNRSASNRVATVVVATRSHDGLETTRQEKAVTVAAGRDAALTLAVPVRKNGYHDIVFTLKGGSRDWIERRSLVRLAPDTRAPFWEEGKGPLFGYWSYHGGHGTPPATNIMAVMRAAGARATMHVPAAGTPEEAVFREWKWLGGPNAWPLNPQRGWAGEESLDPAAVAAFRTNVVPAFRRAQGDNPDLVAFYPEPHISRDLTAGHPPDYWGEPVSYTEEEQRSLRVFMNTSRIAAEEIRRAWPNTKILIPWGDPLFIWPMLRAGFPTALVDGSGLDMIGFERLPEQQLHQMSTHRLYILREEYKRAGITNPLLYYIEGVFVPTEPGACTWDEQAERYHRWSLLSLAYGVQRFYSGWFAFDCASYYGSEHYGGCGIQRRIPYEDPKPAYAHYATMTRLLERSDFERWLPTGSHSVYCLKFRKPGAGPIYALWTVRGIRPVAAAVGPDASATVTVTDSMDNGTTLTVTTNRTVSFPVGTEPIYVTGAGAIEALALGAPDHSDAIPWSRGRNQDTWHTGPAARRPPVQKELPIARFGDGTWSVADERDAEYEGNNFDSRRFPGKMTAAAVFDPDLPGSALAVHLGPQDKERKLMPWYTVLRPAAPIRIPGKACALGVWVKAASDWGRIVYSLRDARGERWISVGTKDQWNCNDVHGWTMFGFDGWRYVRFELPSHSEYDSFREAGTTWWGSSGGDGIVDLPLTLEKAMVERRTHVLYVNDIQPANPADVCLGDLVAEYETDFDATEGAVARNRIRMPLPKGEFALANPIADLAGTAALPPVKLLKVRPPDWGYDGTRCHVDFTAVTNAVEYQVWLGAYPDGRGAVTIGRMKASGGLVNGLRPARKLYLWVTYAAEPAKGKDKTRPQSRPSNVLEVELVDAFSQK